MAKVEDAAANCHFDWALKSRSVEVARSENEGDGPHTSMPFRMGEIIHKRLASAPNLKICLSLSLDPSSAAGSERERDKIGGPRRRAAMAS